MPSVDDALRRAFEAVDDDWAALAPAMHSAVRTRHRRRTVAMRALVGATCAAAVVGALSLSSDIDTRTVGPVDPPPASTSPSSTGPLEGTWISTPLDEQDVRAAARAAGSSGAATPMLEDLPDAPFEVVMVVRGSSLQTSVREQGSEDLLLLDEETLSTTGQQLELRPFDVPAATVHQWAVYGGVLTMSFGSTTEGSMGGVPGEAWHRLLYDRAPLARRDAQ